MSYDIVTSGYMRPCIFFDTEDELRQLVKSAESLAAEKARADAAEGRVAAQVHPILAELIAWYPGGINPGLDRAYWLARGMMPDIAQKAARAALADAPQPAATEGKP